METGLDGLLMCACPVILCVLCVLCGLKNLVVYLYPDTPVFFARRFALAVQFSQFLRGEIGRDPGLVG